MATATAALNVNITDNAQKSASNLNAFTAAAQKAQRVVSDFSQGLVTGAKQAWAEHNKAAQSAIAPTQQFTAQIQKSNDAVTRFADTLTRRFVSGVIVSQLKNLASEVIKLNSELAKTGDIAGRSGADVGLFQGLLGAASNKGVDPSAFLEGFSKLNQNVAEAKRGAGDLLTLFRQNGLAVGGTQNALLQVSNLIKNSGDELTKVNILQAAGLPATQQFIRFMEQGADAIQRQAQAIGGLNETQLKQAQELDDKFSQIGTTIATAFKRGVVAAADFFSRAKEASDEYNRALTGSARPFLNESAGLDTSFRATPAGSGAGIIANPAANSGKPPQTKEQLTTINQQISQQIGLLGNLANADQLVTAKRAELNLASLNNINISKQMRDAILAETRLQKDAADASARLQLGLGSEADIRAQILASLPPSIRAIAEQTEAVKKQTEQLMMQNQVAAAALPGLKQLELASLSVRTQLDSLGVGIVNGITNPLVDLASGATKAGDAFKQMGLNIIRSIEQMIVNMTIAAPIARGLLSIFAPFVPGGGVGWAGQPTALGSASFATAANGNVFSGPGISAFSNSIVDRPTIFPFAKGIGLMGEAGAEAIMPLTRVGGKLGVRAEGGNSSNISVNIGTIALPQDPNGNDPSGSIRAAAVSRALEGTVRSIVKDEMVRGQRPGGMLNKSAAV